MPRHQTAQSQQPKLPATLDHRMKLYSAAAASAGVSLLALAQPAQAKVVYTPIAVDLSKKLPYVLDVNGDGIADFTFSDAQVDHTSIFICALDASGNALETSPIGPRNEPAAFPAGAPIGPVQNFTSQTSYGGVFMAAFFQYSFTSSWGPWHAARNRYLGLKFLIDGEVHYGWVRLTIDNFGRNKILSGYAYETEANTKITTGDEGTDTKADAPATQATPAPQPVSLGMLAMGAVALPFWRSN